MIRPVPLVLSAVLAGIGFAVAYRLASGDAQPAVTQSPPAAQSSRAATQPPPAASATRPSEWPILWKAELGKSIVAAPTVMGQTVFIADQDGRVTSLDLTTGKQKWQTKIDDAVTASPVVVDGILYVGDEGGKFHAMQAESGSDRVLLTAEDKILGQAAAGEDVLYFGSYDRSVYAVDLPSGQRRWAFATQAQVHASPAIAGDAILVAGCDGFLRAIDAKTGQEAWQLEIGSPIGATPAVADGVAFVATLKGECVAVDLAARRIIWRVPHSSEDDTSSIMARPILLEKQVIFAAESGQIVALNRVDGGRGWATRLGGRVASSPVLEGQMLYATSEDGLAYELEMGSGRVVRRFTAGAAIKASAAVPPGLLLLADNEGTVWCVRRGSGR